MIDRGKLHDSTSARLCRNVLLGAVALALWPAAAQSRLITEYPTPTGFSEPFGIAAGPDGALWFTEFVANKIGRITTDGASITEFTVSRRDRSPFGIAAGPDSALWF